MNKNFNTMELLSHLKGLGAELWTENGKLRIDAPKGVLTASVLEKLAERKTEILQFLTDSTSSKSHDLKPILPLPRDTALCASFSQERLWFLSQLEPDSAAYNIAGGVRLEGRLQVDLLEQSLTGIVRRHEALRTTFEEIEGRPVQVISPEARFELPVVDLQELPEAERETRSRQIITEEAGRPFDLSAGPLFRAALVQLSQEEYILVVVMHHIITDGWSLGVFMREWEALYAAFSEGRPSPLPDLPVQYADYAAWQRERLQGEVLEGQVAYWKKQLGGELAPLQLQLPTDRPRPAVLTHRGARHGFDLSKELAEKINSLSRQQRVTLFMTLLAAFKVLLYRYTGQTDLAVGFPIANRTRPELEGLIGFFVNTLVLRTDMAGDPGFVELLGRVRETTLGAYDHQELPFEKLVEVLNPSRDMSYSPLFQVMFVLQNMPRAAVELPGMRLSPVGTDAGASMFDLTLFMWEGEKGLSGRIEYNTDLFDARTIERMVGHFETLLKGVVADPAQRISELGLLTEAERHKLLVEWNVTEAESPADKTLVQLFEEQVARSPEAVAVEYEGTQLTYRELNARANQLAHYLQARGVDPESRVGIWMERSLEIIVALLGTLKTGGAYVPLDPNYPQERLAFMLCDAQVPVLLTRQRFIKDLPEYAGHVVCMDRDGEAVSRESEDNLVSRIGPDDAVYIIYTSGSTGTPKGVIGLHRGAVNRLNWMWKAYPFKYNEVCCQKTYLSFVDSVWEIFGPLLQGVPTVIVPDDAVKDPHLLVESLAANHVSRIVLVPSLLRVLLESFGDLQKRLPELRLWVTSGEEVPLELAKRFRKAMPQARLINLYGSSEVSADVTCYEIGDALQEQRVPIGWPIDNTRVYLLDDCLQPVPVGVHGELYVGGAGLARGYLNKEDLTAERFIPSPFRQREVLFKTGDLGRYLQDGSIEYLGRRDHQVKIRGFRVELGEIESRIKEAEAVGNCVVVLREDRPGDQRLTAYYVPRDGQTVSEFEVRRHLQVKLPEYMVPQHFVELTSIPLTPNGKVDRKALPAPGAVIPSREEHIAPRDSIEAKLLAIFSEALTNFELGVTDNFFEYGGHSLLAVRLVSMIEKEFGRRIPLAALFNSPDVERIANLLRSQVKVESSWNSLVPIRPDDAKPRLYLVHGAGGNLLFYRELAEELCSDFSVYGFQSQGLNGKSRMLTRIEEMAAHYVQELRAFQHTGPYCFVGYCMGGTVAYEMARLLIREKQTLGMVAMLDTYNLSAVELAQSRNRKISFLRQKIKFHCDNLGRLNAKEMLEYLSEKFRMAEEGGLGKLAARIASFANRVKGAEKKAVSLAFIQENNHRAAWDYVPGAFEGKVILFKPKKNYDFFQDFKMGWSDLVLGELEIVELSAGPHAMLLNPFVKELAAAIKQRRPGYFSDITLRDEQ